MDNLPLGMTRLSISLALAAVGASFVSGIGVALVSLFTGQLLWSFWKDTLLFSLLSLVPAFLIVMAATVPAYLLFRRKPRPTAFPLVAVGAGIGALPYGTMMFIGAVTGANVAWADLASVLGVHILAGAFGASVFYLGCTYRGSPDNVS